MTETYYNPWEELTPEQIASNHEEFEASERAIEEENTKRDDEIFVEVNPICHDCGRSKADVRLRTDSYREEVHGDTNLYALCEDCAVASIGDI